MTVEEALDTYKELMRAMFSSSKIRPWSTPKYHHQPFERAMKELVKNRHFNFDGDARFEWKKYKGRICEVSVSNVFYRST